MNTKILNKLKPFFFFKENYFSEKGIFIGNTLYFNSPFFLDVEKEKNYNIAIVAPTGYGKTFLARAIAYRATLEGINVRVIDWNGEYSQIPAKVLNLKNFDESKRIKVAVAEIRRIKREIRKQRIRSFKEFIIVEEAWKISKELEEIAREARKKGFGLIAISQLNKDFENIMENCSTKIFFEERGICRINNTLVKVVGVDFKNFLKIGDKMQMSKTNFEKVLGNYCGGEEARKVVLKIEENGNEIKLEELCKILIKLIGIDKTILFLREIGFKDIEISEAFSMVEV
ncbi:MAG: helicase HerA domain-containing protein [Candidatus Micrarchaeales archaeon]